MKTYKKRSKKSVTSRKRRRVQRGGKNPYIYLVIFDSSRLTAEKLKEIKEVIETKYETTASYLEGEEKDIISMNFIFNEDEWGYKILKAKQKETFEILKLEYNKNFNFLLNNKKNINSRLTSLEYSFEKSLATYLKLIPARHGIGSDGFFLFGILPN
jgi:hypothetical protein